MDKKIGKIYGVPFRHNIYQNRHIPDSLEAQKIRKISEQIQKINRETAYIKEHGKEPPQTPNYYLKKLNIFS